ncbi:hypothetical protein T261_3428 [Streptomyces lydicus]|nr:hypothetical protein T261_3428 [Streptomyces lydicus]
MSRTGRGPAALARRIAAYLTPAAYPPHSTPAHQPFTDL